MPDEALLPAAVAWEWGLKPVELLFYSLLVAGFAAGFWIGTDPLRMEPPVRPPNPVTPAHQPGAPDG